MGSLRDTIYEKLYSDILKGRFQPGERLHIQNLAKEYDAGLSPLREALAKLTSTDLVVASPQKGFRVAAISLEDLHDIYATRKLIEEVALKLSIEKGDDSWEAQCIACFHQLYRFEKKKSLTTWEDYLEWEKLHRAFNLALISACGFKHLLQIQEKIYIQTERYRRLWVLAALRKRTLLKYAEKQKQILDAALRRDKIKAVNLLKKHYSEAEKIITKFFHKN